LLGRCPKPALKNHSHMRHWNKHPLAPSSNWSCFPNRSKVKIFLHVMPESPPWNSTVQPPGESQLTSPSPDGDTFSFADKLPLYCSTLYIISFQRSPERLLCATLNSTMTVKRPHKTSEALQMWSCILLSTTMTRQNSLRSSSRHNQEQLFLFIPLLQTRRLCKGRFTQATWLVHYWSTASLCHSCKVPHTHSTPCYFAEKTGIF